MALFVLSYLAGVLTILAPCILPVLPFVFARVDQPFLRSGLPLLAGMALSFAGVATLATIGGSWAAEANDFGRYVALTVLAAMGIALLLPRVADRVTRPLVALGARLSEAARRDTESTGRSIVPSLALGVATGLIWAPCAGPVLGLVLTTAALQGASAHTSLLLLSYAAGAATSLALAVWVGGRLFEVLKRTLGFGQWLRRGLGAAVLAAVATVALGLDTSLLATLTPLVGGSIEQNLLEHWHAKPVSAVELPDNVPTTSTATGFVKTAGPAVPLPPLPVEGVAAELAGATGWLNSAPLTLQSLRGKVVLVDFWALACINCQRALPHVRAWAEKYKDQGLVVIGVHAPEFAFERKADNVKRAANKMALNFPIAIDNDFAIWRAYANQYWPANYFIDAQGRIRYHHFGEGEYERSEQVIQQLLQEARRPSGAV
ncbi:MAG: cytochrome c biogenesis protein DipZ [Burkholderiales bacterium]|nr:cytochrome c biogenesis protein DipZ [Burkholderiales bacterium]